MIFDKQGNTSIITQEKASIPKLVAKINEVYASIENDNIIVNLFSLDKLSENDILEFLELSNKHKNSNHSFVIVTNVLAEDEIPEEMVVVPTLQEAHDLIEMEEIERDLGF